jgi:hypothetical protein
MVVFLCASYGCCTARTAYVHILRHTNHSLVVRVRVVSCMGHSR